MQVNNSTTLRSTQAVRSRRRRVNGTTETRAVRSRRRITEPSTSSTSGCLRGAPSVTPIQEYSPGIQVNKIDGRHDKMEINASFTLPYFDDDEEVYAFRRFLGAPPEDLRAEDNQSIYGNLLTQAPNQGEGQKLKFRKRNLAENGREIPPPLQGGNLMMKARREGNAVSATTTAYLHLNPSRAVNLNLANLDARNPEDALLGRSEPSPLRGLDGKDNVLQNSLSQVDYIFGQEQYLHACIEGIENDLSRAYRLSQGIPELTEGVDSSLTPIRRLARLESLSARRIETYWEMTVDDAPKFLERITPTLKAFHKEIRERDHGERHHAIDLVEEGNAKSVRMFISKGEEIQVYAKTPNRIRFEVVHKPGRNARLLDGGMTASSPEELQPKLDQLKQKAAERINSLN